MSQCQATRNYTFNYLYKMKRLVSVFLIVLACVVLWSFMFYHNDSAIPVKTVSLVKGSISTYLSVSGVVKGARSVEVISRIPGHLTDVEVSEGGRVDKGQLLARLDDAESSAQVIRTEAIMERSGEKIKELKRKLRRMKEVRLTGGESLQAVEDVQAELNDAIAELSVHQADYQLQKINLELHRVVAPFAGIVTYRNAEVGQAVQPALGKATTLFTVVDDSTPYIEAQVDAGDSGVLSLGNLVEVTTDAWPDVVWEEEIIYIARAVNKQESDATNTLTVKMSLREQLKALLIGQQVDLKILTAQRDDILKVKHNVIIDGETGPQVAVVKDNSILLRSVRTGLQSITHTEIVSGLSLTDQVVVPEGRAFKNGDRVVIE
jgi:RND family efflux transporter MFP subunit